MCDHLSILVNSMLISSSFQEEEDRTENNITEKAVRSEEQNHY